MKLLVFCCFLAVSGCAPAAEKIVVKDAFQENVSIRTNPRRTIICYPSLLEIWLDCGGSLVAIHSMKKDEVVPEEVKHLPGIGGYFHPNAEKILQLKPDLVILSGMTGRNRPLAKLLRKAGIDVLLLKYDNYRDYREIAGIFCAILGRKTLPETLLRVDREIRALERKIQAARLEHPTFLSLFFNGSE